MMNMIKRFFRGVSKKDSEAPVMVKPIKIYTLSTCSHCKATKKFLDKCKVQYKFTDVDKTTGEERKATLEDIKKWNPDCSFPTIIIGDKVVVGFKEKEIKEALGL